MIKLTPFVTMRHDVSGDYLKISNTRLFVITFKSCINSIPDNFIISDPDSAFRKFEELKSSILLKVPTENLIEVDEYRNKALKYFGTKNYHSFVSMRRECIDSK